MIILIYFDYDYHDNHDQWQNDHYDHDVHGVDDNHLNHCDLGDHDDLGDHGDHDDHYDHDDHADHIDHAHCCVDPYDIFNKLQATRIHSLSIISPFYGKSIPTDVYKSFQMESRVFKKGVIFDFLILYNTVTIIVCLFLVAQIKGQT